MLSGDTVYFRFDAKSLFAINANSGKIIEDKPLMVLSKDNKSRRMIGLGKKAEAETSINRGDCETINPFDHPRMIVDSFTVAQKMFHFVLKEIIGGGLIKFAPIVVLHPTRNLEGGITSLEIKALKEIGSGTGARESYVWLGRNLSRQELQDKSFLKEPHDFDLCSGF